MNNLDFWLTVFFVTRYIQIGGKECEYNSKFQLILHTKLANPHFAPELQAQTTLIDFTVTPDCFVLYCINGLDNYDVMLLRGN